MSRRPRLLPRWVTGHPVRRANGPCEAADAPRDAAVKAKRRRVPHPHAARWSRRPPQRRSNRWRRPTRTREGPLQRGVTGSTPAPESPRDALRSTFGLDRLDKTTAAGLAVEGALPARSLFEADTSSLTPASSAVRAEAVAVTRNAMFRGVQYGGNGLWIAPAPWKTHNTRFPPSLGRQERVQTPHRRSQCCAGIVTTSARHGQLPTDSSTLA